MRFARGIVGCMLFALVLSVASARNPRGGATPPGGFAFVSPATLPNATNGGSYFYLLGTSGGTGAVTYAFNFSTSANISSIPLTTNANVTLTGSAASFAGMTQAYIGGYGSQGHGSTNANGEFNSQTVLITGTSGSIVQTSYNASPHVLAANGGTLFGGAITGVTPWQLTPQGYLFGAPTANEAETISVTATDSASPTPNTVTQTFSVTVNSTLSVMGTSLDRASQPLPAGMAGNIYGFSTLGYSFVAAGGTGTGYTWGVTGLPAGLSVSGSTIVGTPTTAGTYTGIVATVTDSGSNQASATFSMVVAANANGTRPAYNSNSSFGLYVLNGQLYGTDNAPITMRGLDRNHYDEGTQAAYSRSGANTIRQVLYDGASDATQEAITASHIAAGQIPVVVRFGNTTTPPAQVHNSTGKLTADVVGAMTVDWCNNFSTWSPVQSKILINVANEWGPISSVWRDAYLGQQANVSAASGTTVTLNTVSGTHPLSASSGNTYFYLKGATGLADTVLRGISGLSGSSGAWTFQTTTSLTGYTSGGTVYGGAIAMLRNCGSGATGTTTQGYTAPIVIDSGSGGQDINDLVNYSSAVFASDPLGNIVFSLHLYGLGNSFPPGASVAQMNSIVTNLVSLRGSVGAVYAMLEFGPSTPPGATLPSPTLLTAGQIITAAEANGIPWAEWAFDDSDLNSARTSWNWFGLTNTAGVYAVPSDLTPNGLDVILNPTYGVKALATLASYLL